MFSKSHVRKHEGFQQSQRTQNEYPKLNRTSFYEQCEIWKPDTHTTHTHTRLTYVMALKNWIPICLCLYATSGASGWNLQPVHTLRAGTDSRKRQVTPDGWVNRFTKPGALVHSRLGLVRASTLRSLKVYMEAFTGLSHIQMISAPFPSCVWEWALHKVPGKFY